MKIISNSFLIIYFFFIIFSAPSCEFPIHRIQAPKPIGRDIKIPEANESKEVQFIVIGDWGEKGNFYQRKVALAMKKIEAEQKIDFILTTGDNFYKFGVKDLNDSHFKESFENIYTFSKPIPWFITLGNHDYMGAIQPLIDYSRVNPNWIFPSPYYAFEKEIGIKETVCFIVTDTNEFIPLIGFLRYRSYMESERRSTQLNWLESKLKSSSAKWKIVIGHHPIYSAGEHGDTKSLQENFLETLEKNNVDIYLAGHEHDLQYLKHPDKKIHFFISGGGSKFRQIKTSPFSLFAAPSTGFAIININEKNISIKFINQDAEEIYKKVIQK